MNPSRYSGCEFDLPEAVTFEGWMAQIYIYGDESGKLDTSDFVSMCGYVGTRDRWQAFSVGWAEELAHRGLPPIHLSQIMSDHPKQAWREVQERFGSDWPAERERILATFGAMIRRSNIFAVGAVVDSKFFRELPDSEFKEFYKDPVFLGFYALLMSGIRRIECLDRLSPIGFIVDDDREKAMDFYNRLDEARTMKSPLCTQIRDRIKAITFARDEAYLGGHLKSGHMRSLQNRPYGLA